MNTDQAATARMIAMSSVLTGKLCDMSYLPDILWGTPPWSFGRYRAVMGFDLRDHLAGHQIWCMDAEATRLLVSAAMALPSPITDQPRLPSTVVDLIMPEGMDDVKVLRMSQEPKASSVLQLGADVSGNPVATMDIRLSSIRLLPDSNARMLVALLRLVEGQFFAAVQRRGSSTPPPKAKGSKKSAKRTPGTAVTFLSVPPGVDATSGRWEGTMWVPGTLEA